jgi:hypothetical protein
VFFSWSHKERIKDNSLVEGALLSTALEELATVSYETGQAFEITDESYTGGPRSHIVIGNQIANRCRIRRRKMTK